jgi:hypothetical protein
MSAFDVLWGFVLASMLARAIIGSAPFFPALVGGFVVVFVHRAFATLAFHFDWFGKLVKGDAEILGRTASGGTTRCAKIRSVKKTCWRKCGSMDKRPQSRRCAPRRLNGTAKSVSCLHKNDCPV